MGQIESIKSGVNLGWIMDLIEENHCALNLAEPWVKQDQLNR